VTWLAVALGAAVGAPLRYLIDRAVQARHDSVFPWGTFAANVTGCFVLGVLIGGTVSGAVTSIVQALVGTGLCGALTTYSTFSYEAIRLFEQRATFYALLNVIASIVAGLGVAYVGIGVAEVIWP
jgi:fluoride exporter